MEITIQIDEPFLDSVNPEQLKAALAATLRPFKQSATITKTPMVSIVITDNETVQQLNHQYRGIDAPTDVLSFENTPDPGFPDSDQTTSYHLGDIVIAFPVAKTQAQAAGHKPSEEVTLLAVHGALHLLGFDHATLAGKNKMWAAQHQIMTELGLTHIQPTEK